MSEMEMSLIASQKEGHKAITGAMFDLVKLGYLVSGISYKNGTLEIICFPPDINTNKEVSVEKKIVAALIEGCGIDESTVHGQGASNLSEPS
jgi:hypothetical protein